MHTNFNTIKLKEFYNKLISEGYTEIPFGKYTIIECSDKYSTITLGNKEVSIKYISKHKTDKHLIKICSNDYSVITTTDHTCMIYNSDHFLENVKANTVKVGDMISIIKDNSEKIGYVTGIEDLGTTEEYVYDLEIDDPSHSFYANDILIHNSQFINLACVTEYFKKENNLDYNINKWTDEYKLKFSLFIFEDKYL